MIKLTVRQIKLNKDIDIGKYRYLDYWKNKRKERNVDGYIDREGQSVRNSVSIHRKF